MTEEDTQSNIVLFSNLSPDEQIAKGKTYATALIKLVEEKQLFTVIQGKKYVHAEGWACLGSFLGVFPFVEYARKIDRDDEIIYEARVILKTAQNNIVGAGEAVCSSKERGRNNVDEYVIKSMAETRATGKAFRLAFSWIVKLAGYEATPSEEITDEMVGERLASVAQKELIVRLANKAKFDLGSVDIQKLKMIEASKLIKELMEGELQEKEIPDEPF